MERFDSDSVTRFDFQAFLPGILFNPCANTLAQGCFFVIIYFENLRGKQWLRNARQESGLNEEEGKQSAVKLLIAAACCERRKGFCEFAQSICILKIPQRLHNCFKNRVFCFGAAYAAAHSFSSATTLVAVACILLRTATACTVAFC